jgi:alanyl aminopeptidase
VPLVDVALQCRGDDAAIETRVARLRPLGSKAQDLRWTTPACFQFSRDGKAGSQCAELENGAGRVPLAGAGACPEWVLANPTGRAHYVPRYDAALSQKLRARMDSLPANGAVALVVDAGFLSESGLMPIAEALAWADAALGHASPIVREHAVSLVEKQRDAWLSPALARAKREIVEKKIVPMAASLGWAERASDGEQTKVLRMTLMPFAAEREEGAALRAEARRLALAWTTDRDAVAANMTRAVLETAARFADGETYAKLEARTLASQDSRERQYLLSALGKAREPKLRERALGMSLTEGMRPRDALEFLENAMQDENNRRATLDFVRANFDPLAAKLPQHTMPYLITFAGALCTREDRDEFVSAFGSRAAKFEGGALRYRQALETLELCVAAHGSPRSYN